MKKALLALALTTSLHAAETLAQQFQNPPEETKPWCYWYWYKSDITQDGITKDLEAMKKAGIRLAIIGNIEQGSQPSGPVKMFSPEWSLGLQELDLSGMTQGFGAMKAKALGIAFLRTGKDRVVFAFEP